MSGSYFIGFIIAGVIAYFVAQDAKKRGMNSGAWAAGVFLLCIVFLPLYFIMRKPLLAAQPQYGVPQPGGVPYMAPQQLPPQPAPPQYMAPQATAVQPLPPAPAPAPQAGPSHCAACGQYFEGPAAFCPMCGAPQSPPVPPS